MHCSVGLCIAAETRQEKRKHLADSELSAWKIKPVLAQYGVAAANCQGGSQENGTVTFI